MLKTGRRQKAEDRASYLDACRAWKVEWKDQWSGVGACHAVIRLFLDTIVKISEK